MSDNDNVLENGKWHDNLNMFSPEKQMVRLVCVILHCSA